jgi:hypothetical protein
MASLILKYSERDCLSKQNHDIVRQLHATTSFFLPNFSWDSQL